MRCLIVTGPRNYNLKDIFNRKDDDYIIGADLGAMILAENNIKFDLALGDFDSVSELELATIEIFTNEIQRFSKIKDFTDTHLAVKEAQKRGYDDIVIYGGVGGRVDHTLANVNLLRLGHITIKSGNEKLYILKPGNHFVKNTYKYISFFALENIKDLSLIGFEYELNNVDLDNGNPLCISNSKEGQVSFTEGLLLVIHQNE